LLQRGLAGDTEAEEEVQVVRSVVGDYLEAIYSLHAEAHDAHATTLADLFGVSRAAASATVGRLARDGFVEYDHRNLSLTATGVARAEESLRRHCISERFLTDVLGMGWAVSHEQAHQFERGLTPFLEERIDVRLDRPITCPHGNPVPRPGVNVAAYFRDRKALQLTAAPHGTALTLLAISELAEHRFEWLQLCESIGLQPGATLISRGRTGNCTNLEVGGTGQVVEIDTELSSRIWVVPAEPVP
jgi:DtxR family Mn-dependent transcriptional regulator